MRKLINIFIVSILFTSCEMEVEVPMPEYKRQITVNTELIPDQYANVTVSHSVGILDISTINMIENAKVELYENGQRVDVLQGNSGTYFGNYLLKEKRVYEVRVEKKGYESVSGVTTTPAKINIISAVLTDSVYNDEQFGGWKSELKITFNDPSDQTNYYGIQLNNELYNLFFESTEDAISGSGGGFGGTGNNMSVIDDALFNGKTKVMTLRFSSGETQEHLNLWFYSLSLEMYKYHKTKLAHDIAGFNPMSEPAPVYSNVNKGLGIIAGMSPDKWKIK